MQGGAQSPLYVLYYYLVQPNVKQNNNNQKSKTKQ